MTPPKDTTKEPHHPDRDRYAPRFGTPVGDWYRWFAWYPVETVDRGRQWLRPVYRRRIHKLYYLDGGADFWFQHVVTR